LPEIEDDEIIMDDII